MLLAIRKCASLFPFPGQGDNIGGSILHIASKLSGLVRDCDARTFSKYRFIFTVLLGFVLSGSIFLSIRTARFMHAAMPANIATLDDNNLRITGSSISTVRVMNMLKDWKSPPTDPPIISRPVHENVKPGQDLYSNFKSSDKQKPLDEGMIDNDGIILEHEGVLESQQLEKELQGVKNMIRDQQAAKTAAEATSVSATKERENLGGWVHHSVINSNTGLFNSLSVYLTDNGADASKPTADTDHLTLFLLGYGEFTAKALPKNELTAERGLQVPSLECVYYPQGALAGESTAVRVPAHVHVTGTAFEHKIKKGKVKYSGERTVLISCGLGVSKDETQGVFGSNKRPVSALQNGEHVGELRVVASSDSGGVEAFNTGLVKVEAFLAAQSPEQHRFVQCSSAIHHVTGTQWIIEWIEYHLALGFDHLHLYLVDHKRSNKSRPLAGVIKHYVSRGVVTAHDWTNVPEIPDLKGVNILNWEHGQRAARNDCFFRNRGRAGYVAFSDLDELWALGEVGGLEGGELDMAGYSFFPARRTEKAQLRSKHPSDRLLGFFESVHDSDPSRIGFALKSVTVPPFTFNSLLQTTVNDNDNDRTVPLMDAWKRDIVPDPDFGLLLGQLQVSELRCQSPYNCGKFHFGRQKYFLRTRTGSVNPNMVLFYHSINEDYDGETDRLMQQVPVQVGYIRHYAGHFKHSRLGGLPANNRVHRPIMPMLLRAIRAAIDDDTSLSALYTASPPEQFLGLNAKHMSNVWRFAKPNDDQAAAEHTRAIENRAARVERARRVTSFFTFEQYKGRLNNQLLTFDWAFRISHAVGRTLLLKTNVKHQTEWIGLPESREEEEHHTSLWNFTGLRRRFNFVTDYDVAESHGSEQKHPVLGKPYSELPKACIWRTELLGSDVKWKNLLTWAKWASALPECADRIHFETHMGLVHPYRTDTRIEGVGQLAFWEVMRPSDYLLGLADTFLDEKFTTRASHGGPMGIHLRSHNSYGAKTAMHAKKSCIRLALKPITHAEKYRQARTTYCYKKEHNDPDQGLIWPPNTANLDEIFKERLLTNMCEIDASVVEFASEYTKTRLGATDSGNVGIFLASDHENKVADELIYSKGGIGYEYNPLAVSMGDPNRQHNKHDDRKLRWRGNIQGVLLDMIILSKTGVFFGNPGSTLTQVVCYWRMSDAKASLLPELSNVCGLVLLSTGGIAKNEIKC